MPPAARRTDPPVPSAAAFGFFGKLPARGDFVRRGLPRGFAEPWDGWLSGLIGASKAAAGGAWLPAFLEAPVWRFALPAGHCGKQAAAGLMLPSVDRVGRYFPLTFAAVGDGAPAEAWLDRCEAAGRAALEQDLDPDAVMAMLGVPDLQKAGAPNGFAEWWTEGGPRVGPSRMAMAGLPDAAAFARMLGLDGERMDERQV